MKVYTYCLLLLVFMSCQKDSGHQPLISGQKPNPVKLVKVENFGGGATIEYSIADPNTLYVLAEYTINAGTTREVKSSKFKNTVTVSGFNKEGKFDVMLYAVGDGEQRSEPVRVEVNPDTPPYIQSFNSLKAEAAFGGVFVSGLNPGGADLVVEAMVKNELGKWVSLNKNYTSAEKISYAIRGLQNKKMDFAFFIRDRWQNYSDTLHATLTPIFESKVDMSKFSETNLPTDDFEAVANGWGLKQMFDGQITNNSFGSRQNLVFPIQFTIFLKETFQLSRLKLWQRQELNRIYNSTNIKRFKVWGSMNPNPDGSFDSSWTLLGEFENIKPSGLPLGETNAADIAQAKAGEDYEFEKATVPVRYIRVQTVATWANINNIHIAELEFYGARVN